MYVYVYGLLLLPLIGAMGLTFRSFDLGAGAGIFVAATIPAVNRCIFQEVVQAWDQGIGMQLRIWN
jgi:hypothetical protein